MTPPGPTKLELIQISEQQREVLLEEWNALAQGTRITADRIRTALPLAVASFVILASVALVLVRHARR